MIKNKKKLWDIVEYAYTNSLMYCDLKEQDLTIDCKDWSTLPIITKDTILESKHSNLSVEFIIPSLRNNIVSARTSGSTGKCMEILWNKYDVVKSMLPLWVARKKYYGIKPDDRLCFFYSIRKLGTQDITYEKTEHALGFSKAFLDEVQLVDIYKKMYEFDPIWMLLQPSIAILLVQAAQKNNLPKLKSLKYIEFSGEMLTKTTREQTKEFFNCDICNQYGCHELNCIAYECPEGNLHCLSSNVEVEIVKDGKVVKDGEEGEIVLTSLHNYATPFIRYNIKDTGKLYHNKKCSCGNRNSILELTKGRSNQWVFGENGEKCSPYIFSRAVENVNIILDNVIKQFQVIQNDFNNFTVKMVIDEEEEISEIADIFISNILHPALQNANFEFVLYETLFLEENEEKFAYFKNKISEVNYRGTEI